MVDIILKCVTYRNLWFLMWKTNSNQQNYSSVAGKRKGKLVSLLTDKSGLTGQQADNDNVCLHLGYKPPKQTWPEECFSCTRQFSCSYLGGPFLVKINVCNIMDQEFCYHHHHHLLSPSGSIVAETIVKKTKQQMHNKIIIADRWWYKQQINKH